MKYIFTLFFIVAISISCTTTHYGYDNETWNSMTAEEKKQVITEGKKLLEGSKKIQNTQKEIQSVLHRVGDY